ncbi:MAG TPA: polysaccharide deacetylase family protein [Solirubrobacteraceae bacterium]|jgi:peptidoglycan/xylan/chitin deacetylase (PgdA/CDA1 family)
MPGPRRSLAAALAALALGLPACGGGGAGDRPAAKAAPKKAPVTTASARAVKADETGRIPVLEYHRVGGDPDLAPEWTISTAAFRRELEQLHRRGYWPLNLRDMLAGRIDVPAGKTPVVLTFDDSSDSQFTYVRRGGSLVPDPDGAVGVLLDFHRRHPDWPLRATWFVLPEADSPNHLFDQPRLATRKLRFLVDHGMEVGSHTLYHANLGEATPDQVREQLARSLQEIGRRLPGYEVVSLSVPFGVYPADDSLLREGTWQGLSYRFAGAVEVSGPPSLPPGDRRFDPFHIPRIQTGTAPGQSREMLRALDHGAPRRFVSDGDPRVVSFPAARSSSLDLPALRRAGKVFRGY